MRQIIPVLSGVILGFYAATLLAGMGAAGPYWRSEYRFTAIEVKVWVDVNGTYGFESIAEARLVPLNSEADVDGTMNWIENPIRLDNSHGYAVTAPLRMWGRNFLFWQSEKTGVIVPSRTLTLDRGFSSDTWWINYG